MSFGVSERLGANRESRSVLLLQGGEIESAWDQVLVSMRTADLLVLNDTLRAWMIDPARAWAGVYLLRLNDCKLFLDNDDLYVFCGLVEEAAGEVPRRVVRWADLQVQIVPLSTDAALDLHYPILN